MNKRVSWIDITRIFATFGVVAIHTRPFNEAHFTTYTLVGHFLCTVFQFS